jgi:hypothetical protein
MAEGVHLRQRRRVASGASENDPEGTPRDRQTVSGRQTVHDRHRRGGDRRLPAELLSVEGKPRVI